MTQLKDLRNRVSWQAPKKMRRSLASNLIDAKRAALDIRQMRLSQHLFRAPRRELDTCLAAAHGKNAGDRFAPRLRQHPPKCDEYSNRD